MQLQGPARPSKLLASFIALFGVILPFVTLGFVAENDFLRTSPIDPVPNALYVLLVAMVPVTNAFLAVALWRGEATVSRPIAWLHTVAIGIALAYSLQMAPLAPISVPMVLWYGIGLLPLSPMLALAAAVLGRRRLQGMPPVWAGLVVAAAAIVLADFPAAATRVGMKMAIAHSATVQASGRYLLRHAGSDAVLKRACEARLMPLEGAPGAAALNLMMPVTKEQARRVYFELKGEPYYLLP